jgi:AcrR family transcriptional regulator
VKPEKPEQQRLLELVGDHLLAVGSTGLSLSAIARAVGSNNRMLLYYFNSRDSLVAAASLQVARRFPYLSAMTAGLRDPGPLEDRFDIAWGRITHPDNLPYLRLFFEMFGAATRSSEEYVTFLPSIVGEWVDTVRYVLADEGYGADDALRLGIQIVALWRGLQMALLSGADVEHLRDAQAVGVRSLLAGVRIRPASGIPVV